MTERVFSARRIGAAVVVALAVVLSGVATGAGQTDSDVAPAPTGSPPTQRQAAKPVTVWDTRGATPKRCSQLTPDGKGGCGGPFVLSEGRLDFTVQTLAGELQFAPGCLYNYDLRIGGDGRTVMDGMIAAGGNPCNDVRPCVNAERSGWLPWSGRIRQRTDGTYVHEVDACVDTCLGQFKGLLVMRLTRHGRLWRASIERTQVGDSGYVFSNGTWDWKIPGLKIVPAGG